VRSYAHDYCQYTILGGGSLAFNKLSHKRFDDVTIFLRREGTSEFYGDEAICTRPTLKKNIPTYSSTF
jgi:hypothetical protein